MSSTRSLLGHWDLKDETDEYSLSFELPGDGITALVEEGLIKDPYFGKNEYDLRWICERDWIAQRVFTIEDTNLDLVISKLDTICEIRINDQLILETKNAFKSYRKSLVDVLSKGENNIEIRFKSVTKYADAEQASQPYYVPCQSSTCPIKNGNMVRKPQCDFGWDWNIALAPFGLFGDIYLEPSEQTRLTDFRVQQIHEGNVAFIKLTVSVINRALNNQTCIFSFFGQTVIGIYDNVKNEVSAEIKLENPDLWWPVGQGHQYLHAVEVSIGDVILKRRIGICDIKLVSEPDEIGRSFKFVVNGRPVFAKGANWIPADALAGKIKQDDVRDLLQSAIDANMNMIRIWGGGRYEPDWFYDMCDELGIMVWHDLMFSCNLYPATEEFLNEIQGEVREAVTRIDYHASLAVWCGDNELIGALDWHKESKKDRDRYLVAYDRLNRVIEQEVKRAAPHSNWWPSSPSPGPMSFGDAWHDDTSGDMHFWSVWHEGRDFDHYRDVSPRFCSEFGFQSYPSINIIRQFASEEDLNIASPVMESHQKNTGGNARIAETMFRYFRFPNSFENFIYLSQVQQGLAIKTAVSHWRSLKPTCMGALVWQLNDTWPVCSWASLNYGGDWKLLHHMEKHFFAPLYVSAVPAGEQIILRASNDSAAKADTTLDVFALSMSGEMRKIASKAVTVDTDAAIDVLEVARDELSDDDILFYEWTDQTGQKMRDHFAPNPYKSYQLPDPKLQLETEHKDGTYYLTLTAGGAALFVSIEADISGRFSDNGFILLPDEELTISFIPKSTQTTPEFVMRDLRNATL